MFLHTKIQPIIFIEFVETHGRASLQRPQQQQQQNVRTCIVITNPVTASLREAINERVLVAANQREAINEVFLVAANLREAINERVLVAAVCGKQSTRYFWLPQFAMTLQQRNTLYRNEVFAYKNPTNHFY